MKRFALGMVLMGALAAAAGAGPLLQADVQSYAPDGANRIKIEFPVGKFTLEGDDGRTIRVQLRIDCKDADADECQAAARRIRLDHSSSGGMFRLEFSGVGKNWSRRHTTVEAHVLVPRALAAELNMGVGSANVTGMRRDIDVELGVGELNVRAARADTRRVDAEAGVGGASIDARAGDVRERGFIGHTARWTDGPGNAVIRAQVGVGQSSVSLR